MTCWPNANQWQHCFIFSWYNVLSFLVLEMAYTYTTLWNYVHLTSCEKLFTQFLYCSLKSSVLKQTHFHWVVLETTVSDTQWTLKSHPNFPSEKDENVTKLRKIMTFLKIKRIGNQKQIQLKLHNKILWKSQNLPILRFLLNNYQFRLYNCSNNSLKLSH